MNVMPGKHGPVITDTRFDVDMLQHQVCGKRVLPAIQKYLPIRREPEQGSAFVVPVVQVIGALLERRQRRRGDGMPSKLGISVRYAHASVNTTANRAGDHHRQIEGGSLPLADFRLAATSFQEGRQRRDRDHQKWTDVPDGRHRSRQQHQRAGI